MEIVDINYIVVNPEYTAKLGYATRIEEDVHGERVW